MARIRLTLKLAGFLNGVDVSSLNVGDVIELPDSAADMLVAEQWAEFVSDPVTKRVSLQNPSLADLSH